MEFFPSLFTPSRTSMLPTSARAFEEAFNNMFKSWPSVQTLTPQTFPLDIVELNERYVIKADLPEVDRKDVNISFENNLLTVHVEVCREEEKKEANYLLRERLYGECARTIPLPLADSRGTIEAVMKDGILKITVPKSHEKQTKKIEIH